MPARKLIMDNFSQYSSLDDILNDAIFGESFKVTSKPSIAQNADQRLVESFEEINQFIDQTGHAPAASNDINERKLYSRLLGLREEALKCEMLQEYDRHHLLIQSEPLPSSLDDILNSAEFTDLIDDEDIFTLKHIPLNTERESADFVARRKQCKNFAQYEELFKQCHAEIKSGQRKLVAFNEANLTEKSFFVAKGVLGYLDVIYDLVRDKNSKLDGRVYSVFENGTESNMLFRSLGKMLYEDGFLVSASQVSDLETFNRGFEIINDEDQQSGYIYVLKSRSTDSKIVSIDNLYKIGYSTMPVEERIKNAENEATYLMAAVEIMAIYQCYNMNPQKFEQLLHKFFGIACLNLDIFGEHGARYNPREWFTVPLHIINQAIELIISGEIINYRYNYTSEMINLI